MMTDINTSQDSPIHDTTLQVMWFCLTQFTYLMSDFFLSGWYEYTFKVLSLISVVFLILVNWKRATGQLCEWFKRKPKK